MSKIKVMNAMDTALFCLNSAYHSFFDYMPEDFCEVFDVEEADCFFTFAHGAQFPIHTHQTIPAMGGHPIFNEYGFDLSQVDTVLNFVLAIKDKPCIVWMDCFAANLPAYHERTIPDMFKEYDLLWSCVDLPEHPNTIRTNFIDSNRFYKNNRFTRIPKSVCILSDHLHNNIDLMVYLMPYISQLHILGMSEKLSSKDKKVLRQIRHSKHKIRHSIERWPDGVRNVLNRCEYVFTLNDWTGQEMLGFEGGFCGSQPVYPLNTFYESLFGTDSGVEFFNLEDPVETLKKILQSENTWSKYHQSFTQKYSAKTNMPEFWDRVRKSVIKYRGEK